MGRDSADINSPPFTGDDILGLLDTLRRDGFAIGLDEYLNVQEILSTCAQYDLNSNTSLRNWLSPVLCTNAEEQRLFYQRFESWWKDLSRTEPDPGPVVVPDWRTPLDDEVEHLGWRFRLPLVALATLALAVSWFAIKPLLEEAIDPATAECQRELPQLVNLQETNARREIEAEGLVVGDVKYTNSESTDKGDVVAAVWQVGTKSVCRVVSITISEGAAESELQDNDISIVLRNYKLHVHGRVIDHKNNAISGARVIIAPGRYFSDARGRQEDAVTVVDDEINTTDEGRTYLKDFQALGEADIILIGHQDGLNSAAFSPDGSRIVTASEDGTARVWNADGSGEPLVLQGHEGSVWSAAFSPDGSSIVTASEDGTARVWNAEDAGVTFILQGHERERAVYSAAFSPDGSRIVTASEDETARIWSADGSGEQVTFEEYDAEVTSAAFSPDGSRIVTTSADETARVRNTDGTGEPIILRGYMGWVNRAAFSPDGLLIVTASEDKTVRVWNADGSGEPIILQGHKSPVRSVVFSPDGLRILSASEDGTARVWNADGSGEPLILQGHEAMVLSAVFSPDGSRIVTASNDKSARIWEKDNILDTQHWTETGADGKFDLNPEFFDDAALIVSHDDYKTALQLDKLSDPGSVQFKTEMVPLAPRWLRTLEWVILGITSTLISLLLALGVYRWFRNRKLRDIVLEHRAERNVTSVAEVNIAEPPHELYHGADFIHARTVAYRREQSGSGRLDEDATIDQTVRRLGYFTPVYRSRLQLPNYLALIDRASFGDQQACLVGEFIDRLVEGGVSVDRYFFDRDPRVCASAQDANARHRSLRELAARFPGYRLLIFSDGQGLAHPFAGGLARWVGLLDAWPERVLMTPVPTYHWSQREIKLTATGLLVLPATSGGLQRFVEHITHPAVATNLPRDWSPAFPEVIELQPSRWLEREAPPEDDQSEMLRQLRGYLGNDAYRWLSALAVYPELKWYITLYLGLELKRESGEPLLDEVALLNLTRLPWLRHGLMPDWMREQLIASLSAEDEQAIRSFLFRLLRNPLEDQQSRLQLNIARSGEQRKHRRWSQVFKQLLVSEPDDSPLQDAVFVEFLSGKRPGRLQFLVPQKWHGLLFNKGMYGLGLKTAVSGALTLVAAVGILSLGIGLRAVASEIFSSTESSKITEVERKNDESVLGRFEVQNPGFSYDENSRPIASMDGYNTNRCLRECEARKCVAAEVTDDGECRLFASYNPVIETGSQNVHLYLKPRVPMPPELDLSDQRVDQKGSNQGEVDRKDQAGFVEVPVFIGLSLGEVELMMKRVTLALGDTVYLEKVSAQEARVISQAPVAGSRVERGTQVVLSMGLPVQEQNQEPTNNTGSESSTDPQARSTFSMPSVIGLTVVEAQSRVLSAGRNAKATSARAQIASRQADARPAGQIIQQLDAVGKQMRPYMDDVGGKYGEVTFRVVVSTGDDRNTTNQDSIEPLNEYVAEELRNSVAVVRLSSGERGERSSLRYFMMEEPPARPSEDRVIYSQATAFFVSEDGLMITALLPPNSSSVTVQLPDGRSGIPVFSVLQSREFNLEAIAIEGFSGRVNALSLYGRDPERGAAVYLLGYALNTDWRLLSGRVLGQADFSNGQNGFVTSIDYQNGFSGAPVVDQKGLLVGVAQSGDASGKVVIIPVEQAAYFRKEVDRAFRDLAE